MGAAEFISRAEVLMMMTYQHEIAARVDTRVQYWKFLWNVNATSGRTEEEIANDIALELDSFLGWYQVFRALWANSAMTARYRLRVIRPTASHWYDLFWKFSSYGGLDPQEYGSIGIRLPIWWFSTTIACRNARTEIGMMRGDGVNKNQVVGLEGGVIQNFIDIHLATHTTLHGDSFVPAIINTAGQVGEITSYRFDGRVSTRKVRDRYR